MAQEHKRSVYLTDRLRAVMGPVGGDAHGTVSLSGRITRIADRYGEILTRTRIQERFTPDEWDAICHIVIRLPQEPAASIRGLAVGVGDILPHEQLADPWPIDVDALLEKLRALSYTEEVALMEAVEQWWIDQMAQKQQGAGASR